MHEEAIPDQLAMGIALAHIIEFLKTSRFFPWLSNCTPRTTRAVSMALAWATGIGFELNLNNWSLVGGGSITMNVPMLSVIVGSLLHGVFQWGAMQGWYQAIIRPAAERREQDAKREAVFVPSQNERVYGAPDGPLIPIRKVSTEAAMVPQPHPTTTKENL